MADEVFSVRLPPELKLRLEKAAAANDRTAGQEARRAIKSWLAEKVKDPGPLNDNEDGIGPHSVIESTPEPETAAS